MKPLYFVYTLLCFSLSLPVLAHDGWVTLRQGAFYDETVQKPFNYKACSMWYASLLGQKANKEGRKRLRTELDSLKQIGVNVVEALIGVRINNVKRVSSVSNHTLAPFQTLSMESTEFSGTDYLLAELQKRNMKAVFIVDYRPNFTQEGKDLYQTFLQKLIRHRNNLTKKRYTEDATLLAWKLCDTPSSLLCTDSLQEYVLWVDQMANFIKCNDKKHLVVVPYTPSNLNEETEGKILSFLLQKNGVDYVDIHFFPFTQGWVRPGNLFQSLANVFLRLDNKLALYNRVLASINKPYVLSVAYPRDALFTRPATSTEARDAFFNYILTKVEETKQQNEGGVGVLINGWGGIARPNASGQWDDCNVFTAEYTTDKKGFYSVFSNDTSTLTLLKDFLK